jgi:hypothetical protein
MLGFADLMPDYWHPEGPATGQLNQGFPWFSLISEQLVPKFHVALHASHAALPTVALEISPCTNVTLTFDFGLDHPVYGGYG